ncbi:expressed unknown protein [Seminavis robusta]|uniref:Uncharacterized protein n=1 Tax=Seminavis robusta TaxID=568900 RepID=A0A9N8DAP6_9STRA|nr:expressed unknown protein [Seminavis robusta]|eukprot:Sro63_g035700.1 n/a (159) ;mRNA; f:38037-38513
MFNPSQGWIKRCLAFILALNRHVNAFPAAPRNPLLVDQRFLLQKNPFTAANHYSRQYFTTVFSQSTTDDAIDIDDDDDDENARSQFGTRQYWDDLYLGRGDFPADEYSWYFGWEILQDYVQEYLPSDTGRILCPGIGNDSILVDLYRAKYHKLTAFDY